MWPQIMLFQVRNHVDRCKKDDKDLKQVIDEYEPAQKEGDLNLKVLNRYLS